MTALGTLVAPGFLSSGPVRVALVLGSVVSLVSAPVGVLTVVRRQSFAGHALGDIGATGGAGAFLLGVSALWGFLASSVLAVGAFHAASARERKSRDVATGIVLGAALGLSALLLYLDANSTSTTGATMTVLFGSLFVVPPGTVPLVAGLGAVALVAALVCYRPLLLAAIHPDVAAARGVRVRWVELGYLLALAVAVALSAMTIGAVLSTALLVGPSAAALRLTRRPGSAVAVAAILGVAVTFVGILLAYDSYDWPPVQHGWPASFFVVALLFVANVAAGLLAGRRTGAARRRAG